MRFFFAAEAGAALLLSIYLQAAGVSRWLLMDKSGRTEEREWMLEGRFIRRLSEFDCTLELCVHLNVKQRFLGVAMTELTGRGYSVSIC